MKKIWHDPLEIPGFDTDVVFVDDLSNIHTGYATRDNDGITDFASGEIYTIENLERWAYITDLVELTKTNNMNTDLTQWTHKDLQELVKIKNKNIDHYLDRIKDLEQKLSKTKQGT